MSQTQIKIIEEMARILDSQPDVFFAAQLACLRILK